MNKKSDDNILYERMCKIAGIRLDENLIISDNKIYQISDRIMGYLFHDPENALNGLRHLDPDIDPDNYFRTDDEYKNFVNEFQNDLYQTLKKHLDKLK